NVDNQYWVRKFGEQWLIDRGVHNEPAVEFVSLGLGGTDDHRGCTLPAGMPAPIPMAARYNIGNVATTDSGGTLMQLTCPVTERLCLVDWQIQAQIYYSSPDSVIVTWRGYLLGGDAASNGPSEDGYFTSPAFLRPIAERPLAFSVAGHKICPLSLGEQLQLNSSFL